MQLRKPKLTLIKEDTRQMERTLSVNYLVIRQNRGVLLNTFVKTTVIRFLSVHSIYLSLLASCIDVQCCIFRPLCFSNVFNNTPLFWISTGQFTLSVLSIYLVGILLDISTRGSKQDSKLLIKTEQYTVRLQQKILFCGIKGPVNFHTTLSIQYSREHS